LMLAVDCGENALWEEYRPQYEGGAERPNQDGHPAMVSLLLKQGANEAAIANDGKTTALSLAKKNGFSKVEKLLLPPRP